MRDGIENPQSLYERCLRSFSNGLSHEKDGSRRTVEQDPDHSSIAENEVPSYRARVDTLATERGNMFEPPSPHGASRSVRLENASHHLKSLKDVDEEEIGLASSTDI